MKLSHGIVSLAAAPAMASGLQGLAGFKTQAARFAVLATSHVICESKGYTVDPAGIRTLGQNLIRQGTGLGMTPQESENVVTAAMGAQMAADKSRLDAMPDGAAGSAAFDAHWAPRCASLAADPAFAAYIKARRP